MVVTLLAVGLIVWRAKRRSKKETSEKEVGRVCEDGETIPGPRARPRPRVRFVQVDGCEFWFMGRQESGGKEGNELGRSGEIGQSVDAESCEHRGVG